MSNEKKSSDTLKIIIIVSVVCIVVLGGAFAGFYFFMNKSATAQRNTNAVTSPVNSAISQYTYGMDEYLVNLADEGGKRYFKVKIFLGYSLKDKKALEKEFEDKKPILRDAVNYVLRAKKSNDITQKGTEDLKKELKDKINSLLEKGKIENVYFNDILLQ